MHSFKALGISSSLLYATIIIKFQQSVAGSRNGPVLDQASTAFLSLMFDRLAEHAQFAIFLYTLNEPPISVSVSLPVTHIASPGTLPTLFDKAVDCVMLVWHDPMFTSTWTTP